jgi:hypothetical protein
MLYRRGGEAFHCIHSELNGCGKAAPCQDCAIRNGVAKAMTGGCTWRELHAAELRTEHGSVSIDMLVTASLLPYTEPPKALLILEDVTETTRAARR